MEPLSRKKSDISRPVVYGVHQGPPDTRSSIAHPAVFASRKRIHGRRRMGRGNWKRRVARSCRSVIPCSDAATSHSIGFRRLRQGGQLLSGVGWSVAAAAVDPQSD